VALSTLLLRQNYVYLQPSECCFPISAKTKKQQTSNERGWVLRSGRGQLREIRSTSAAPPAISRFTRSTFQRQHQLKDLCILPRDIHLIEIKYCKDTRPQNQLSAVQEQHNGLCTILQGACITLHTILLGVAGTIYNNHTPKPFKELVLILKELRNLLPSFMFILTTTLPNLSIPDAHFPVQSSTLIRNRFQIKPATLQIPIDLFSYSFQRRSFTVPGSKVGSSFSSIYVGSGFH
jgi:hypothetical protein